MGFLDIFKKKEEKSKEVVKSQLKATAYPIKILVAWGEAIDGNEKIRAWLIKNGYSELGMFCFALKNDKKAQEWLMEKGYPHMVALIKGIEGEKSALDWLRINQFEMLWHMALAADGNIDSKRWLLLQDKVYAALSKKMERVKNDIEWSNNSIHTINP